MSCNKTWERLTNQEVANHLHRLSKEEIRALVRFGRESLEVERCDLRGQIIGGPICGERGQDRFERESRLSPVKRRVANRSSHQRPVIGFEYALAVRCPTLRGKNRRHELINVSLAKRSPSCVNAHVIQVLSKEATLYVCVTGVLPVLD